MYLEERRVGDLKTFFFSDKQNPILVKTKQQKTEQHNS